MPPAGEDAVSSVREKWEERARMQAEPTAAWARRWNVAPGALGNHPGVATYSGFAGYVRKGWIPILDRLAEDLIALGWNRTLDQVKQKFGALRFYIGEGPAPSRDALAAIDRRIEEATAESLRTCEECGAPGRSASVGGPGGWAETLCPRCFENEDAEVRARRAEEEREQAALDEISEAEDERIATNDPEYRAYLEEFVYPRRIEERRRRPLRTYEIRAAIASRRCGVCRRDLSSEPWTTETSATFARDGRCPRCGLPKEVPGDR